MYAVSNSWNLYLMKSGTMKLLGKSSIGAVLVAIALAGIAFIAPSAASAATTDDCPSGSACWWDDALYKTNGYGTHYASFTMYSGDFSAHEYSHTAIRADYSASSVWNSGKSNSVLFYKGTGMSGAHFTITKGHGDGNLANSAGPTGFNDNINSGCFSYYC